MVTLKDVAEKAGVSLTTASRVLNRDTTMSASDKCRKAIFEAAFELGYVPLRMKKQLNAGKTLTIGVADWHILLEGYKNVRLSSLQYLTELMTLANPLKFVQIGQNFVGEVDGLIAFGDFSASETVRLQKICQHIVFVNSASDNFSHDRIVVNISMAIHQAMDYIKAKPGCRRVGYLGGVYRTDSYTIGTRRTGLILSAIKANDLYSPSSVILYDLTQNNGYGDAAELIRTHSADAFIIGSDVVARGFFAALEQQKVALPDDLTLVLYRDIDSVDLVRGEFASIRAYSNLVWQKAIQMLLEQIAGRTEMIQMIIPSKFVQ